VHRRCINTQPTAEALESIHSLWQSGEEVRGWARYWAGLYRWVSARLQANPALRQATLVVRYEDLCDRAEETLGGVIDHCALSDPKGEIINCWSASLSRPVYYQPNFTPAQERAIAEETDPIAAEFGYK
jgi:hypothetical protein